MLFFIFIFVAVIIVVTAAVAATHTGSAAVVVVIIIGSNTKLKKNYRTKINETIIFVSCAYNLGWLIVLTKSLLVSLIA